MTYSQIITGTYTVCWYDRPLIWARGCCILPCGNTSKSSPTNVLIYICVCAPQASPLALMPTLKTQREMQNTRWKPNPAHNNTDCCTTQTKNEQQTLSSSPRGRCSFGAETRSNLELTFKRSSCKTTKCRGNLHIMMKSMILWLQLINKEQKNWGQISFQSSKKHWREGTNSARAQSLKMLF